MTLKFLWGSKITNVLSGAVRLGNSLGNDLKTLVRPTSWHVFPSCRGALRVNTSSVLLTIQLGNYSAALQLSILRLYNSLTIRTSARCYHDYEKNLSFVFSYMKILRPSDLFLTEIYLESRFRETERDRRGPQENYLITGEIWLFDRPVWSRRYDVKICLFQLFKRLEDRENGTSTFYLMFSRLSRLLSWRRDIPQNSFNAIAWVQFIRNIWIFGEEKN